MRKYVLTVAACFFHLLLTAQLAQDYVIPVRIKSSAASIIIEWPADANARNYTIRRKVVTGNSYLSSFTPIAFIDNSITLKTSFVDTDIQQGILYEYEISGNFTPSIPEARSTYTCAGINVPAIHHRGSVILLCDSSIITSLTTGIEQLYKDLVGDGWKVIQINVDRRNLPANVKTKIVAAYNDNPDCKQVLIIGHVPVPYSGDINPDGHSNHKGCWAADGYYGSMTGNWTDTGSYNSAETVRPENINLPGDGKFDLSYFPGIQLAVGRIDFANMPAFANTESTLLSNYLNKNHRFRHSEIHFRKRALIEDNFPSYSEKFSQSAWKSYASLLGYDNIALGQYETDLLNEEGYLWSYGNGGGNYTSAGGIGSTTDFANRTYKTIFTQLFGSYFGDWDSQNNFMRASLASGGTTLTCVWGGRPHWFFHHMGAGFPIGYSEVLTMNNDSIYNNTGNGNTKVHIGLMGDPSLRNDYPKPVEQFDAVINDATIDLSWTPAAEQNTDGYFIYRSNSINSDFIKLNEDPVIVNSYTDTMPVPGNNVYMIRSARKDSFVTNSIYYNSSTYINLSQGVFDSVNIKVYRFTGNGNWNNADNWLNNSAPPSILPSDSQIIITPSEGGACILNMQQIISPGAKITVKNNKRFTILGKLTIQ